MQPHTNYTTYDRAYYYADLKQMPLLSRTERDQLLAPYAHTTAPLDIETRNALVEEHLRIANAVILRTCPHGHHDLIPDMIGAVNLALVEIVSRYHVEEGSDLTNYLAVCAEKITLRTLSTRKLINVPYHALERAKEQGTEVQLYDLQPVSLDQYMESSNTDEVDEPLATPILPTNAAPERNSEQRAQVEAWLSYLSPLEQTIVRMRYGLYDDDEHTYSIIEIGKLLGIPRGSVDAKCRDALGRLKQLASGTATIVMRQGKPRVKLHQFKPPILTSEQEEALMQHAQQLAAAGTHVTYRELAQVSGFSGYHVHVFLQARREQFPSCRRPSLPRAERYARLEQAYQELEAAGVRPTYQRLQDVTHIGKQSVCDFFRLHKQVQQQACLQEEEQNAAA